MGTPAWTIVALAGITVVSLSRAAGTELEELRGKYDAGLERLAGTAAKEAGELNRQYAGKLRKLAEAVQDDGDLDKLVAVRSEIDRFQTQKTAPERDQLSEVAELRKLQKTYRKLLARIGAKRDDKRSRLAKKYEDALQVLEKGLTQRGDVDEALRVRAEREELRASETFPVAVPEDSADASPPGRSEAGRGNQARCPLDRYVVHGENDGIATDFVKGGLSRRSLGAATLELVRKGRARRGDP